MTFVIDTSNPVWVNAAYIGGDSDGTLLRPFRTVTEGYHATPNSNTIRIISGNYPETLTMSRPVRVEATNGLARIGSP